MQDMAGKVIIERTIVQGLRRSYMPLAMGIASSYGAKKPIEIIYYSSGKKVAKSIR
jgi:hypothetical protein